MILAVRPKEDTERSKCETNGHTDYDNKGKTVLNKMHAEAYGNHVLWPPPPPHPEKQRLFSNNSFTWRTLKQTFAASQYRSCTVFHLGEGLMVATSIHRQCKRYWHCLYFLLRPSLICIYTIVFSTNSLHSGWFSSYTVKTVSDNRQGKNWSLYSLNMDFSLITAPIPKLFYKYNIKTDVLAISNSNYWRQKQKQVTWPRHLVLYWKYSHSMGRFFKRSFSILDDV